MPDAKIDHEGESYTRIFQHVAKAGILPLRETRRRGSYLLIAIVFGVIVFAAQLETSATPDSFLSTTVDGLWAMWIYLLIVIIRPQIPLIPAGAFSLAITWTSELCLLSRNAWPAADETNLDWLIDRAFHPFDLVSHLVGIVLAVVLDRHIFPKKVEIEFDDEA